MNLSTECFFSGIHHVAELCHSRLALLFSFFLVILKLLNIGPGFRSRRGHVQWPYGKHRMVLQSA